MPTTVVLIVITLSLLFASWLWSRRRFYRIYAKLPGPLGLPFIGLAFEIRKPENLLKYFNRISKEYKTPFILWMGPQIYLYVSDPVTVETVFQSPHCTNKGDLYRLIADAIGDGLFTSSSPRWNKHRRLLNPAFGRKTVESFLPIFNGEVNVLVKKCAESKEQSLELYELLKKSVLEVACQTTMGQKMNFHNDGSSEILDSYTSLLELGIKRLLSPWLYPQLIYQFTKDMKEHKQAVGKLYNFIETLLKLDNNSITVPTKVVTAAGDSVPRSSSDGINGKVNIGDDDEGIKKSKSRVFIECMRNYIQTGQLTFLDVRDEANVAMAATFETTSTALYFACLCLAIHPEYQDKLYNELVTIFPNNDKEFDVTLENLDQMTYTEMVINEAMRLFSPVPVVLRSAAADFNLNDGTVIPQGTQIAIDIFNMQRSEKVWGPNALSFDPEDHFGANNPYHPYAFIPFTKGLRMCIGYRYAKMLMKIIVAKIFRNFRVHTDAKMADLAVKGTISLKLSEYPLCKFYPRENTSPASQGSQ